MSGEYVERPVAHLPVLRNGGLNPEIYAHSTCFEAGYLVSKNAGWRKAQPEGAQPMPRLLREDMNSIRPNEALSPSIMTSARVAVCALGFAGSAR